MTNSPIPTTLKGGLSTEDIAALLSSSRTRNAYAPKIIEFDDSDDAAINVREAWPTEFSAKNASTLYQGFNNALNKADPPIKHIQVKRMADDVFLLHMERVNLVLAEAE